MNAPPDAERVRSLLTRASRRRATIALLRASTVAIAVATIVVLVLWLAGTLTPSTLPIVAAAAVVLQIALAIVTKNQHASLIDAAKAIEQRAPSRNLVVTSAELLHHPPPLKPHIVELVHAHAANRARDINVDRLFAVRGSWVMFVAAIGVYGCTSVLLAGRPAPARIARAAAPVAARISRVDAVVLPPAYTRKPPVTLLDPTEIRALAGSRVSLNIVSGADRLGIETMAGTQTISRDGSGVLHVDIAADRDGFVALAPIAGSERQTSKRLIALVVDADQAPLVRIDTPGRDLFVASTNESIPVVVSSTDDIGLADLRVTYTTVTGTGEDFTFHEGELPLQLTRTDGQHWNGTATLALNRLSLSPGDTVVYRAIAKDVRPGAASIESDSFMVHLSAPDRAIVGGFTIDDDFNRYAISQQMVIVKTERLIAQRPRVAAAAFLDQATEIAAEQRRVRAEFVFMMGGETEDLNALADTLDETAEAARETDLAAGRLQNRGAIDLIFATRHMSKAALSLGEPDTTTALKEERAALTALQRAFSKDRYLLRTLSSQQQLDQSRRLGGKFADLARDARPSAAPAESARLTALRSALASLAALAADPAGSADQRVAAAVFAQKLLAIDPASSQLRDVAASLTNAAGPQLDRAALALAVVVRNELPDAPSADVTAANSLKGDVADALNRLPPGGIKR